MDGRAYPSDLTDAEYAVLPPHLPPAAKPCAAYNAARTDTTTVIDQYNAVFLERAPDKLVDIIESRTLDGRTQELICRATLHN